jgi:hypothetical protein
MPEVEYAFLADAAQVQPGQKFHVLGGGVSRVTGPSLPFVHPHLSLVLGLRLGANERDREHDLGVVVEAPDRSQVATASGKFVPHGSAPTDDIVVTIAIDLWSLDLRIPGEHLVRISIDGTERKRLSLMVAQLAGQLPEQKYIA